MSAFKIGDRVKVVDASGDRYAVLGAIATVTGVERKGVGDPSDFLHVTQENGSRYGMWAHRFEHASAPRTNGWYLHEAHKPKTFKEGDRVIRTGPHIKTNGGSYEGESKVGMTGTIASRERRAGSRLLNPGDVRVEWDKPLGYSKVSQIAETSLSPYVEPKFAKGDKVVVVGNSLPNPSGEHHFPLATVGVVEDVNAEGVFVNSTSYPEGAHADRYGYSLSIGRGQRLVEADLLKVVE